MSATPADADVVIVGGGPAGCLMLLALCADAALDTWSVALIDRQADPLTGRWWAYWATEPLVRGADSGQWDRLVVERDGRLVEARLDRMRYRRLDGSGLARRVEEVCSGSTRRRRVPATVIGVGHVEGGAVVRLADGAAISTRWVLDSTAGVPADRSGPWLSFLGRRVWPEGGCRERDDVGLMDFAVPQRDGLRFGYCLPETAEHLFLELCAFRFGGPDQQLEDDLPAWISARLGGRAYRSRVVEDDAYALVRRGSRRLGPRHLAIGRRAGLVRSATGYGVFHYARDACAIAGSLARHGHPYAIPRRTVQRRLDAVALEVLRRDPARLAEAYLDLFQKVPADRVLSFLAGESGPRDVLAVMAAMPQGTFLGAAARALAK